MVNYCWIEHEHYLKIFVYRYQFDECPSLTLISSFKLIISHISSCVMDSFQLSLKNIFITTKIYVVPSKHRPGIRHNNCHHLSTQSPHSTIISEQSLIVSYLLQNILSVKPNKCLLLYEITQGKSDAIRHNNVLT